VRKGFFEPEQFESVKGRLKPQFQGIVAFAYITGWRTPSEILPLEWRQVDMKAGEVRLDPGTTKNDDGRVFPFTRALRRVLEDQQAVAERLKREQGTIARYVFCYTIGKKTGQRITEEWVQQGVAEGTGRGRLSRPDPARLSSDRRSQPRAGRRAGAGSHAAH
jgi:integrase